MSINIEVRSAAEIHRMRREIEAEFWSLDDVSEMRHLNGVLYALEWVLGLTDDVR